ncbi:MAG: hypothetical protein ACE5FH_12005 [Candidatus Zixiibacteriota bacterium]
MLSIASIDSTACGSISVPIGARGFSGVAAGEIHISYDSNLVSIDSATATFPTDALTIGIVNSRLNLVWESFQSPISIDDDSTAILLFVTFLQTVADGTDLLFAGANEVVDELGDPLPLQTCNGRMWCGPQDCCVGMRGDVDNDGLAEPDIVDLSYLVDYLWNGGCSPLCDMEADVNGDGLSLPDIVDLSYLVDYLWQGGPTPPSCP